MSTNNNPHKENAEISFDELFNNSINGVESFESQVAKGKILSYNKDFVIIDVGLKSEGKIPISEFKDKEGNLLPIEIGSYIEVFIEKYEDQDGNILLSRDKAKREEVWFDLEKKFKDEVVLTGLVTKRVKGGFSVILEGTMAFLPGSQLDVKPIKNINSLVGTHQKLQIIKMEKKRYNIIVSRKVLIEKNYEGMQQDEVVFTEGQTVEGTVKNVTGYGAFIDLGSVDGLLHVTDISWSRVNHPSEVLQIGQTIKVMVTKVDPTTKRISLGMKQLLQDPWLEAVQKYGIGKIFKVKVTNLTDYGAFVQLEEGIEGLVHISELSWRRDLSVKDIVKVGDEFEIKVLEIDTKKRRINLSKKQTSNNPWHLFEEKYPENSIIEGTIKNINEYGILVTLDFNIEGFIKIFDISWGNKDKNILSSYNIGDKITSKVLKVDKDKEKISLGIKQLEEDPFAKSIDKYQKGTVVTVSVKAIFDNGVEVDLEPGLKGFIKKVDLSMDKEEKISLNVGDTLEALITYIDSTNRSINLSVRALETMEQKTIMTEHYKQSQKSKNTLGDAISKAFEDGKVKAEETTTNTTTKDSTEE